AGPEPDHPGDPPRVGGDANPITGQGIVASHSWGVGRSLSGPALMPGRRSGRARFAPLPVATPEPRSRGFAVWGFRRMAQAPTARNPVNGVQTPTARRVGDPPSPAGRDGK